jgi:hypothetical protein
MREIAVSEYYSEGPKDAIWLMDFEYTQLTGVVKCELNTWEWQNSKVASATLSIPYESTLLMQGTQYPTSNLVMPQLHQMIGALEMPKITYVHTAQRETISIHEALEKAVMPEKMKLILKARTQMVESIYKYFDLGLSESHRAKSCISARYWTQGSRSSTSGQHAGMLTIHNCTESACRCVRLHDMKTDMLCVVQSKVRPQLGLAAVT